MGNICGRDEEGSNTKGDDNGQLGKPLTPRKMDDMIPDRKAASPTQSFDSPAQDSTLISSPYVETTTLNPMHPAVKKVLSTRPPRDFRGMAGMKEHLANPIAQLQQPETGNTYNGHVVRFVPHGWGTLITTKGEVLEGLFYNGKPARHLRLITQDGNDYEGDVANMGRNGTGTLYRPDGVSVSCNRWVNNIPMLPVEERDGAGRLLFRGQRNTKGLYDGNCTVGYRDYSVEGNYVDGRVTGVCKKVYNDGRVYEGTLNKDLVEEGNGSLLFVDGRQFKGPFVRGLPNGKGTFISDSGKSSDQTWKDGRRV